MAVINSPPRQHRDDNHSEDLSNSPGNNQPNHDSYPLGDNNDEMDFSDDEVLLEDEKAIMSPDRRKYQLADSLTSINFSENKNQHGSGPLNIPFITVNKRTFQTINSCKSYLGIFLA